MFLLAVVEVFSLIHVYLVFNLDSDVYFKGLFQENLVLGRGIVAEVFFQ
jgi:hypothetical protein